MSGDYPALHRLESAVRPGPGAGVAGPFVMFINGTVNIVGGGSGGTSMVDNNPFTPGGTSITPAGGYFGGRTISSGNAAAPALDGSAVLQVNVIAGGAGGGAAQTQVQGTAANWLAVGYQSGPAALPGGNNMPVAFGSGNVPSMGVFGLGGSVGVIGAGGSYGVVGQGGSMGVTQIGAPWSVTGSQGVTQLGAPWSVVGSTGVTPLATFTVALDKIPTVNLGLGTVNIGNIPAVSVGSIASGSMNVLAGQAGAPWSFVGSVNTTPQGVQVVDTRGSLVPTQWIISFGGSGQSVVAGSAPASQRIWFSSFHLVSTGTTDIQWQSPSGNAISGSMRIVPGAGFGMAGAMPNSPVLIGSQQSPIFLNAAGTQNVGGVAVGWIF